MSVPVTQSVPVIAPAVSAEMTTMTGSEATQTEPSPTSTESTESETQSTSEGSSPSEQSPSTETSSAQSTEKPAGQSSASKGSVQSLGLVQKLEQIGALPKQPTIIETLTLTQQMPEDVLKQQTFMLDLFNASGNFDGLLNEQNQTFQSIMIDNPIQKGTYE